MTSLLILLGVVLSSLTVYAQIEPPDYNKLEGEWYEIGLASEQASVLTERRTDRMGIATIEAAKDGDFYVKYDRLEMDGSCSGLFFVAKKADKPWRFKADTKYKGFDLKISLNSSSFKKYILLQLTLEGGKGSIIHYALYARSRKPGVDLKANWKMLMEAKRIPNENIFLFRQNGECKAV